MGADTTSLSLPTHTKNDWLCKFNHIVIVGEKEIENGGGDVRQEIKEEPEVERGGIGTSEGD